MNTDNIRTVIETICKYHVETNLAKHRGIGIGNTGIQKSRVPNQAATKELCGLEQTVHMGLCFLICKGKSWTRF